MMSPIEKRTSRVKRGWKTGFAEADITPPIGRPMAGFGLERYAKGMIAPLRAQALALQDGRGRKALILTADIIGFDTVLRDLLRARLKASQGLEAAAVLLCPSHTHWGPGILYRINFYAGLPDVYTRERLTTRLLALAEDAFRTMVASDVEYTELETSIGRNRRFVNEDGSIGWGVNTEGHYDTHTPVLRIQRLSRGHKRKGKPPAVSSVILVGHACHPTSSGKAKTRWSPDYPGAMRETLEAHWGDGCRAMFVMGCGANAKVVHQDKTTGDLVFSADPQRARQAGRRLARAVIRHLQDAACVPLAASLEVKRAQASLPLGRRLGRQALRDMASREKGRDGSTFWAQQSLAFPDERKAYEYEAVAWILGDQLTLFGLPDEVCSPVGPRTREQARTPYAMTLAYANSIECYIPTNTIVREGGYEGFSSHQAYCMPAPFSTRIDQAYVALITTLLKR